MEGGKWNPKSRRERAIDTHSWLIYRVPPVWEMIRLPLTQLLAIQPTQGHLCNVCGSFHRTATPLPHPASSRRKPCDPAACPPLWSFPTCSDPVSVVLGLQTWFEAQSKKPSSDGFVGKPPNPACSARPPAKPLDSTATVHRLNRPQLRLDRLATIWPALSPAVHRVPQTKPTCLSITRRPLKAEDLSHPFFTCNNTN
jgi:hypothetical protein